MDYEFWNFFGSILIIRIDTKDFLEVWKFCFYCCYLPKMNVLRDYTSLDWGNDFSEQPFQVKGLKVNHSIILSKKEFSQSC